MGYKFNRTDNNQLAVVKRFRSLGCQVFVTSNLGHGFGDILVRISRQHKRPYLFVIEIKDGSKPPSQQKLTPDEEKFHELFEGCVHIITCEQDVDNLVRWVRE